MLILFECPSSDLQQVVSHVRVPSDGRHNGNLYASEAKDRLHSPSVSSTRNGFCKV